MKLFTSERALVLNFFAFNSLESTTTWFSITISWVLIGCLIFVSSARIYSQIFNKDRTLQDIKEQNEKNKTLEKKKKKLYLDEIIYFTPFIINPFYAYYSFEDFYMTAILIVILTENVCSVLAIKRIKSKIN